MYSNSNSPKLTGLSESKAKNMTLSFRIVIILLGIEKS